MIFTKTEIRILELFVSKINDSFTIREISRQIKKDLKIVHTSVRSLIEKGYLKQEKHYGLRLDYTKNIPDLSYAENIRKEEFFRKNKLISAYLTKFINNTKQKFFVLLIFGSYASGTPKKTSDIDLLAIVPEYNEAFEKELNAALSLSSIPFHINIASASGFCEMLKDRETMNVANETLNCHIIAYGAETYYALLGERDVR